MCHQVPVSVTPLGHVLHPPHSWGDSKTSEYNSQTCTIGINSRNDSRATYLTCTSITFWQVFTDFNRLQMPVTEKWFWLRLRKKKAISWSLKSHRSVQWSSYQCSACLKPFPFRKGQVGFVQGNTYFSCFEMDIQGRLSSRQLQPSSPSLLPDKLKHFPVSGDWCEQ